ncbi:Beta-1,4-mannosyltransferase [Tyrophagus putrescentiae]|nr:Beta-1,4-mannosyltransferase [Tyrophagus putrescentiae]
MFELSSGQKHALHCCLLLGTILFFELQSGGIKLYYTDDDAGQFDPFVSYGYAFACSSATSFGLVLFNAFPEEPVSRRDDSKETLVTPFICIRTVTRGDFPDLIRRNVTRNIATCIDAGLQNFLFEVVTDKPFDIPKDSRIRLIVVPPNYKTKSGTLFKARALQYCLEADVNILGDNDWVVHLDEETLLTCRSINGIMNFVSDGRHQFGQGLITYANEEVVNWWTTLADTFRVAEDMGKLRCQFYLFHKPLFSWKGSFVVTKFQAERDVSFDNGLDGSVAEDCYFAMVAFSKGYSFNFIEGEMWEKSPFTLADFLQQRKRWVQGIYLVVHSRHIPLPVKFLLSLSLYAWLTMPLTIFNLVFASVYPLPPSYWCNFWSTFIAAASFYMYIFGVFKSFTVRQIGLKRYAFLIAGALFTIPFNVIIEITAVIWGIFSKKHKFYIVQKQINRPEVLPV